MFDIYLRNREIVTVNRIKKLRKDKRFTRDDINCLYSGYELGTPFKDRYEYEGKKKYMKRKFPVSGMTYYNWERIKTKKEKEEGKVKNEARGMRLETLYEICSYFDISADYILGFIDTKRKEITADGVREEFGLNDEAMEFLANFQKQDKERKISNKYKRLDFINFFLHRRFFETLILNMLDYFETSEIIDSNEKDKAELLREERKRKSKDFEEKFHSLELEGEEAFEKQSRIKYIMLQSIEKYIDSCYNDLYKPKYIESEKSNG